MMSFGPDFVMVEAAQPVGIFEKQNVLRNKWWRSRLAASLISIIVRLRIRKTQSNRSIFYRVRNPWAV